MNNRITYLTWVDIANSEFGSDTEIKILVESFQEQRADTYVPSCDDEFFGLILTRVCCKLRILDIKNTALNLATAIWRDDMIEAKKQFENI
jgi:hypothetical protein